MTAICACGNCSITVNALPKMHGVCHCTNCKRRTGSAFGISAYFERSSVTEIVGETRTYAFHHAAKNHDQERHFCARCGTTLYWYISAMPEMIGIAGGCFGEQEGMEPAVSVTDAKRVPWVCLPGDWRVIQE